MTRQETETKENTWSAEIWRLSATSAGGPAESTLVGSLSAFCMLQATAVARQAEWNLAPGLGVLFSATVGPCPATGCGLRCENINNIDFESGQSPAKTGQSI